jgi:ribosomal protein S18 acetylase RimI-like enzyme
MQVTIREAVASDFESLCILFDEGDARHREMLPWIFRKPPGAAREKKYVQDLIADEATGFFVAQAGDRLVGLIAVAIRQAPELPIFVPRRYAVVDTLVVKREFQRTGIGRALMEQAQAWADAEGAESIELNVWAFNQEAVAFYKTLGYGTVSYKMSKRLSPGLKP